MAGRVFPVIFVSKLIVIGHVICAYTSIGSYVDVVLLYLLILSCALKTVPTCKIWETVAQLLIVYFVPSIVHSLGILFKSVSPSAVPSGSSIILFSRFSVLADTFVLFPTSKRKSSFAAMALPFHSVIVTGLFPFSEIEMVCPSWGAVFAQSSIFFSTVSSPVTFVFSSKTQTPFFFSGSSVYQSTTFITPK